MSILSIDNLDTVMFFLHFARCYIYKKLIIFVNIFMYIKNWSVSFRLFWFNLCSDFKLVNNWFQVLHVADNIFEFASSLLWPLLIAKLFIVSGIALVFEFFGDSLSFDLFLLEITFLVKLVFHLMWVFIATIVEVIDRHENLTQIEIFIAKILIAFLYLWL